MTDEIGNLVLEQLRLLRSQIGDLRTMVEVQAGRFDTLENELRGIHYIMASSVGSLVNEIQDHEGRITRLEVLRP